VLLAFAGAAGAEDAVPDDRAGDRVPAKSGSDCPLRRQQDEGQFAVEISDASLTKRFSLETAGRAAGKLVDGLFEKKK
jgi:hypothetical protein